MPLKKGYNVEYKNVILSKQDLLKITCNSDFSYHSIQLAYRFIRHLYNKRGFSISKIANTFSIDQKLVESIVAGLKKQPKEVFNEEIEENPLASSLKDHIGKKTLYQLLSFYNCNPKNIETLLKNVYEDWHRLGTYNALSQRLCIYSHDVSLLILFIRKNEIIKNFRPAKKVLSESIKQHTIKVKQLYDETGTLVQVAKCLGITRERVRQILERGNQYGIIEYKTSYLRGFDNLVTKISKKEFEKLFIKHGSRKNLLSYLKSEFKISSNSLNAFIKLNNIDLDSLIVENKRERCKAEYLEMVQELGFHPTTTIMQSRPKWRALWSRIGRLWGSMDNFRKEFGIPIPQKGSPTFREDMLKGREERLNELGRIKSEKMQKMLNYINNNSPVSRKQVQIALNLKSATMEKYVKELVDENKIDWMWDGKKYLYFRKI